MNMRQRSAAAQTSSSLPSCNEGALLTFIKDRLFFTCLQTPPIQVVDTHYFSIDNIFVYQHFFNDFGPLKLAHVVRFCGLLKNKLEDPALQGKRIVFYSGFANDKKANALFLICTFMMLVYGQSPEEAHKPVQKIASSIVPFRDAGYGANTYQVSILDCMKGLQKALDFGLLDLRTFDLEEYEYYERVEHGDLNWLVRGKFAAFATPHDDPLPSMYGNRNAYPKTTQHPNRNILPHGVPWRLNDMVRYFRHNKVTTVIRLNHKVYERERFIEQGIEHIEMYFDDGSCPPEDILARFLEIAEDPARGPIAVHCKAGLGRTGSLIAAYLMKHYRFTASEIIGYMRILRPGSVVGPQQNWLHNMQARLWAMGDADRKRPAAASMDSGNYVLAASVSVNSQRAIVESAIPATKMAQVGGHVMSIPVQPRKGSTIESVAAAAAAVSAAVSAASVAPLVQAIDMLLLDSGNDANNSGVRRYNLRSANRSSPPSRSDSVSFDNSETFTPRTMSSSSLKIRATLSNNVSLGQHSRRRQSITATSV